VRFLEMPSNIQLPCYTYTAKFINVMLGVILIPELRDGVLVAIIPIGIKCK
jgi:hypothetical protein